VLVHFASNQKVSLLGFRTCDVSHLLKVSRLSFEQMCRGDCDSGHFRQRGVGVCNAAC